MFGRNRHERIAADSSPIHVQLTRLNFDAARLVGNVQSLHWWRGDRRVFNLSRIAGIDIRNNRVGITAIVNRRRIELRVGRDTEKELRSEIAADIIDGRTEGGRIGDKILPAKVICVRCQAVREVERLRLDGSSDHVRDGQRQFHHHRL